MSKKRYSATKLTQEEYDQIRELFFSDLPAGEIGEQYNLEISVVTSLFKKEFTKEEVEARRKARNKKKNLKTTTATCQECNETFSIKKIALAHMKKEILCPTCKSKQDFKSQEMLPCPVCNLIMHDIKGLTNHIKHRAFKENDQAHFDYFNKRESEKWSDQQLNVDYVECQICKEEGKHFSEYRMTTLRRHIPSVHKMTVPDYESHYDSPAIAVKVEERRVSGIQSNVDSRPSDFYDRYQTSVCAKCNKEITIHAHQSQTQYTILCQACRTLVSIEEYNALWEDKKEGVDYVECKVPDCKTEFGLPFRTPINLKDHLRFNHNLTPEEYESLYNTKHYIENKMPGCGIIDHRLQKEREHRVEEQILCSESNFCIICQEEKESGSLFGNICQDCISREEDQEGNLYCKFPECSFKSLFLAPHIIKTHRMSTIKYCEEFPGSYFVSSKIRKKQKKSGGWAKDLTKETDPRIANLALKNKGKESWQKGSTKETDRRLKIRGQKVAETKRDPNWIPPDTKIHLCVNDFKPYLDKKGLVLVSSAIKDLKISYPIVRREYERLGLQPKRYLITQHQVLELISKITKQPFEEEQTFDNMRNPETDRKFRYDGYFPGLDLIVEYHGYHHYMFPNHIHKNIVDFKEAQNRDYLKRELALNADYFFLVIRFDDPYEDEAFIRANLKETFGNTIPWISRNIPQALKKARSNIEIPFLI